MRVRDRADRRAGHHGAVGLGGRGRGRVLLADGLQENAERQRSAAASDPSAQPDVHESRPDVRTVSGLLNVTIPTPISMINNILTQYFLRLIIYNILN